MEVSSCYGCRRVSGLSYLGLFGINYEQRPHEQAKVFMGGDLKYLICKNLGLLGSKFILAKMQQL